MDNEKTISFIENSFVRELLLNEDVTDISYNGSSIYYMNNKEGRMNYAERHVLLYRRQPP